VSRSWSGFNRRRRIGGVRDKLQGSRERHVGTSVRGARSRKARAAVCTEAAACLTEPITVRDRACARYAIHTLARSHVLAQQQEEEERLPTSQVGPRHAPLHDDKRATQRLVCVLL
jgi:hypothetical protein